MSPIAELVNQSIKTKQRLLAHGNAIAAIDSAIAAMLATFHNSGKVLFCGNGGSAADAQHIAAELSGRFYLDRKPLFAEALHVNSSFLTAVANDYGFEDVFARMVEAAGRKGDVLVGLSTSGNSENIIRAVEKANQLGMTTIGLTGEGGGKMKSICAHLIDVPFKDTPRIQECHILIGHIICELVEKSIFKS